MRSRNKNSVVYKNKRKHKEPVELASNLKDIEKRILLKMKLNNKTDRKKEKLVIPALNKDQRVNRYLQSPGSDKPDNSFPKLANSSMTSAYSSPYGKHTEQDNDMRVAMNKEHISDAMNRIKKSIARSQSIRNTDLSTPSQDEYYHRRENPYDSPSQVQYPEVQKSQNTKSKAELQSIRASMPKLFDKNKSSLNLNKRYEIETADSTESSFGYKFMKKSPSRQQYNDIANKNRKCF